jgi:hypothetical protein
MLTWIVALVVGAAAVVFVYGPRPGPARVLVPAALRFVGMAGLAALLLNATLGGRRPARPIVAMDMSASWIRSGDSALFAETLRRARSESRGALLLFGDSIRDDDGAGAPGDRASLVKPAVDRSLASGRPLRVFTDGELDDPQALAPAVGGSSIVVARAEDRVDVGIAELRSPRSTVGGDTIDVDVVLAAGGRPAPGGRLALSLGDRGLGSTAVDSIGAHGERVVRQRVVVPRFSGPLVLRATLSVPGDLVPGNDTLAAVVEVLSGAAAVLVSTAPDYDARELGAILRGTVLLPTRGFHRVAPGRWREDGSLGAVTEDEVRRAAREAPLLVLHGDTAIFGEPRALGRGALLLVAPPAASAGEWYATGAPPSPMTTALSGSPWDSLPPLDVSAAPAGATFEVLEVRRARRLERRVAAVGWERPRRTILVPAAGFWRWRFRGGAGATVHAAFWGSVIDWLAAERADARAASPAAAAFRSGERIRWQRGTPDDTLVPLAITRRGSNATDSTTLRFPAGAMYAESAPREPGVYDVTTRGGAALLVVNPSAELLPRRPTVSEGDIGAGVAFAEAPRLRTIGWVFLVVIVAFCVEWILRRNLGLR